ncbi:PilZ domain-containing protein [Bdellovibrionota bacterium FG-2]
MDDRRKDHRKKITFPVLVLGDGVSSPFRVEVLDLSAGGMGLLFKKSVEKDSVL